MACAEKQAQQLQLPNEKERRVTLQVACVG